MSWQNIIFQYLNSTTVVIFASKLGQKYSLPHEKSALSLDTAFKKKLFKENPLKTNVVTK